MSGKLPGAMTGRGNWEFPHSPTPSPLPGFFFFTRRSNQTKPILSFAPPHLPSRRRSKMDKPRAHSALAAAKTKLRNSIGFQSHPCLLQGGQGEGAPMNEWGHRNPPPGHDIIIVSGTTQFFISSEKKTSGLRIASEGNAAIRSRQNLKNDTRQ